MILAEKLPVPLPFVVLLLLIVGFAVAAQHIPLAVTAVPPSDIILPPDTAPLDVIPVIATVVSSGIASAIVEKVISLP